MQMREPVNTLTHLFGILFAAIGLVIMLFNAIPLGDVSMIVGAVVFGISMILLYSASSIYHWYIGKEHTQLVLRKIDHSMIFILIAGTYTPICLTALKGTLGTVLLIVIWALAIIGLLTKVFFINMPRKLSAGIYLFLGWIAIFFIYPLIKSIPLQGVIWLVLGGIFYTIGSIIYAKKSEKIKWGAFGFHEIFHVFILLGTFSHFMLVNQYLILQP